MGDRVRLGGKLPFFHESPCNGPDSAFGLQCLRIEIIENLATGKDVVVVISGNTRLP